MTASIGFEPPAKKSRTKPRYRSRMLRALLDAALAGVVFTLASSALVCTHARAGIIPTAFHSAMRSACMKPAVMNAVAEPTPLAIVQIATASSPADAVYRQTSVAAAWTLLGIAFSLMVALNSAIVRHLKRAYATPVRRFSLGK